MDEIYDLKEMALMGMRKLVLEALDELKFQREWLACEQQKLLTAEHSLSAKKEYVKQVEEKIMANFEPTGRNADERKRELLRAFQKSTELTEAKQDMWGQEEVVLMQRKIVEERKAKVRNAYDTWQTYMALLNMKEEV